MSASNSYLTVKRSLLIGFILAAIAASASAQTPAPQAPSTAPRAIVPPAQLTPPTAQLSEPTNSTSRAIEMGVLEELGVERVGLLDEASGGLPNSMWDGSDPALVRSLLSRMPRRMPSLAMRTVAHNLLLPAARQPRGKSDSLEASEIVEDPAVPKQPWLLEARVAALAGMGDWPSVNALLDLVPQDRLSEVLVRTRADGLLIAGNNEAACAAGQAALARQPDTQWQKLLVYCQFASKQSSAAQLGLSLLREQGLEDPIFFWAADVMQGQRPPVPSGLQRIAPLELVMLRAAGRALPEAVMRGDDPTVLRIAAAMPQPPLEEEKLSAAQKKERTRALQESRIIMSERAVALGVLDPEMLRARYLDLNLSQDAKPITLEDATADNVRARVMMFQAARKQTASVARAEVIAKALTLSRNDRGQSGPDIVTVGRLYAPMLVDLTPSPDLLWFAGTAARGLLAAGMPDKAQAWIDMVRQMARGSVEAAEITDSLWAIEHIASLGSRVSLTPRNLRAWQATVPATAGALPRQTLLSLLSALGDPINAAEWQPVLAALPPPSVSNMPSPAAWQGLSLAARDARLGAATAFSLVALGDGGPHLSSQLTLRHVIENLMIAGRENEARLLATEAALVQGL